VRRYVNCCSRRRAEITTTRPRSTSIRPGKSPNSCYVETFIGSLRDECLNVHWFETIDEAKVKIEAWRVDYNESRLQQALNELTPSEYAG
jgi:putative transposase